MTSHTAHTIRNVDCWNEAFEKRGRRTLLILLPTYYNPDALGVRKKIEPEKWHATMVEIERFFSGCQQMHINGWNSEDNVKDDLHRFEVDLIVNSAKVAAILSTRMQIRTAVDLHEVSRARILVVIPRAPTPNPSRVD